MEMCAMIGTSRQSLPLFPRKRVRSECQKSNMVWRRWREINDKYGQATAAEMVAARWRAPTFLIKSRGLGVAMRAATAARSASVLTSTLTGAPRATKRANLAKANAPSRLWTHLSGDLLLEGEIKQRDTNNTERYSQ